MIKKLILSFILALILSSFVAVYFFIKAMSSEDYQLEKSNDRTAVIFKFIVDNARLKRIIAADLLEVNNKDQGYDFHSTALDLRNKKQFSFYNLSNLDFYLDEYLPDSGNQFIRYKLTGLSHSNDFQQDLKSDKCWQLEKCQREISLIPSHISQSNFMTSYNDNGTINIEFPIFKNETNIFIGKLAVKVNLADALIYRSHDVTLLKGADLDSSVSNLKFVDKKALFGERFSYTKTHLIGNNLTLTIFTPYTSLIREKLDGVKLLFVTLFVLFFSIFNLLEQRKNNVKLQSITYNDPLTNLYNRQYFDSTEFLNDNQKHLKEGGKLSVIVIDGDGIKSVNDQYGHAVGDAAIQHIANTISDCTRNTDVAFRTGGDEFVVILRSDLKAAESLTQRIKIAVQSDKLDIMNIHIKISAGFTELQDGESLDVALNRADKLLYVDKANNHQQAHKATDKSQL
ncbi:GGDEF domain-containing protein [Shewanella sp. Isolate11]|uniref:GGDEF domain-containing protein n=1 Tax=Shewanella sp. Isolate11 TaxID=2908530 RepID=UPI001EFE94BA|nr:GGDEF domain-containing protein [Shewanella sp. Isolate11]MCG9696094.1 GGDEF domain-containing protein [Shewanella sp. Isolate11]